MSTEETVGGDPVCWLERVCDSCGALADGPPAAVCQRCGARTDGEPDRGGRPDGDGRAGAGGRDGDGRAGAGGR